MHLGMKIVHVYVDQMEVFVIINNVGKMINPDVNAKKLIDKGRYDDRIIWNPSLCECECGKSCNIGQYLDYENCKCRMELIDKLVEECREKINGN